MILTIDVLRISREVTEHPRAIPLLWKASLVIQWGSEGESESVDVEFDERCA